MASNLIGTIDSDDEVEHTDQRPRKTYLKTKKRKRPATEEVNGAPERAQWNSDFAFDTLGGGFGSQGNASGKDRRGDVFDLTDTIDLFKKKNQLPLVNVDDVIARHKPARTLLLAEEASSDASEGERDEAANVPSDELEVGFDDGSVDSEEEDATAGASGEDEAAEALDPSDLDFQALQPDGEDDVIQSASEAESDVADSDAEIEDPAARKYFASPPPQLSQSRDEKLPPFSALPNARLSRPILLALQSLGLTTPTPIQAATIPVVLMGKDVVGSSVTGSGKTVAFWVGVIERLFYRDRKEAKTRVVCICPTRELAVQVCNVGKAVARYTDIMFCLCVGGLSLKSQETELKRRPDVVVSTPGRLIDHVRNTHSFSLDALEILIIDEADRILEEGFRDELTEIVRQCPHSRSTLLFSATITEDVNELARLSLDKPVRIKIDNVGAASATLTQEFLRIRSKTSASTQLLKEATLVAICRTTFAGRTIVFFRSKVGAHRMKVIFGLVGLAAGELHGDLSQEQRLTSLQEFREGKTNFLLATDLASRGLDIRGIENVINFDMPNSVEIYLHRVGRTARAGSQGRALTLVEEADRKLVKRATKLAPADSVKQRVVQPDLVREVATELTKLTETIDEVLDEEVEEKAVRRATMEITRGENLIEHADGIRARPARTWFQGETAKKTAKDAGTKLHNDKFSKGEDGKKGKPNLTHKERRRLEARREAEREPSALKGSIASSIREHKRSLQADQASGIRPLPRKLTEQRNAKAGPKRKSGGGSFGTDMGDRGRTKSAKPSASSPKKSSRPPPPSIRNKAGAKSAGASSSSKRKGSFGKPLSKKAPKGKAGKGNGGGGGKRRR